MCVCVMKRAFNLGIIFFKDTVQNLENNATDIDQRSDLPVCQSLVI